MPHPKNINFIPCPLMDGWNTNNHMIFENIEIHIVTFPSRFSKYR